MPIFSPPEVLFKNKVLGFDYNQLLYPVNDLVLALFPFPNKDTLAFIGNY
jgi:hypothetical protein